MGGAVTVCLLLICKSLSSWQVGMGDGGPSEETSNDSSTIALIAGHFIVSAVGLSISQYKFHLWIWAVLAHALILIAYFLILIDAKKHDRDGYNWPREMKTLAAIMIVYFSPWLITWGFILSKNLKPLKEPQS